MVTISERVECTRCFPIIIIVIIIIIVNIIIKAYAPRWGVPLNSRAYGPTSRRTIVHSTSPLTAAMAPGNDAVSVPFEVAKVLAE